MNEVKTPLVSVIVVTYNSANYVVETLESVKDQTWQNIELVITDDGSTDQTIEICSNWLSENHHRFNRTELITFPQNTGIPSNCNRGLHASHGEWIKAIAGDDILLSKCIEDNLAYTRSFQDAYFITSDVNEIDEQSVLIRDNIVSDGLLFITSMPSAKKQLKAYTRWPVFLNAPTFFCKQEVYDRIGNFDENFRIYDDTTMVIRMLENGYKLHYMKTPTVAYRIHQHAISRRVDAEARREKEALMVFKQYRKKHLCCFNLIDLSVYYENWLCFKYKGIHGHKGVSILRKLSLFYWYMKLNGVKSY